jgi:AcrR family transcriptional regulator
MSNWLVPSPARLSAPQPGRLYGGLPALERRAERRARFMEAAIAAFGRDGFARTTTRSLCAEAGLTQRYFYESFATVEELFEVVARKLGEELEVRLLDAAARAPDEPEARLRSVLLAYFEGMRKDANAARILLAEVYTAGERTGSLAFRFTAHLADLLKAEIDAQFPRLKADGIDSGLMAAGFIGATHHIALKWMVGCYREPLSAVVATAMRIYTGSPQRPSRAAFGKAKRERP